MKIPSDDERRKAVNEFLEESKGRFKGVLLIGVSSEEISANLIQMSRMEYEQALNAAIAQMHKVLAEGFEEGEYVH